MSNMTQERTVINLYSSHGARKKKILTQYPLVSPVCVWFSPLSEAWLAQVECMAEPIPCLRLLAHER